MRMSGVEPDDRVFVKGSINGKSDANLRAIKDAFDKMRARGYTYGRVTAVDARHVSLGRKRIIPFGFWIEAWVDRPRREAPFYIPEDLRAQHSPNAMEQQPWA